jgi:hypothetical protein
MRKTIGTILNSTVASAWNSWRRAMMTLRQEKERLEMVLIRSLKRMVSSKTSLALSKWVSETQMERVKEAKVEEFLKQSDRRILNYALGGF